MSPVPAAVAGNSNVVVVDDVVNEIHTLTDFLERSETRFRVFDMGRRVIALDERQFRAFELFEAAYPYPLQQQAWFGLLGWNEQQQADHFIWFLRLPLDELGCLVPAARHDFIYRLLEHTGARVQAREQGAPSEDVLAESPYGFKPQQNRMAVFHARVQRYLQLPASRFYAPARQYLSGEPGYEQWQFLGVQGLADVSARWDLEDNRNLLAQALPNLPTAPWGVLCECLENEMLDTGLVTVIIARVMEELHQDIPHAGLIASGLRAISYSSAAEPRRNLEQLVLQHPVGRHIEVLAALAGRCWGDLQQVEIAGPFLEALARSDASDKGFRAVLSDLMFIPGMRPSLLESLRSPQRSPQLAQMAEAFFSS